MVPVLVIKTYLLYQLDLEPVLIIKDQTQSQSDSNQGKEIKVLLLLRSDMVPEAITKLQMLLLLGIRQEIQAKDYIQLQ
uniref:Uncharacterized protein n=1 Tax=viral metagenome TaxID=1070528 RepID=A0A6C0I6D5_9ZZZZ